MFKALEYWRSYRAFAKLPRDERHIAVYSESGQDWHHFAPVIEEIVATHNQSVIYLTSDPEDPGLSTGNPKIRGFCIGSGTIRTICFQWLDVDFLLMTMVDFNNLQLKRSIHPVRYAFMFHSLISVHMADHEDSYDHYDAIFCAGPHQGREVRKREAMKDLPEKALVPHGYHRLEQLMAERRDAPAWETDNDIRVLLAPSWGEQTILNLCGSELVGVLLEGGFQVILRPHYQTRWNTPEVLDAIIARYQDHERFSIEERMGDNESLHTSHVMITDWSGAGMDYGMGLEKPVLYVDVPPKARNDVWPELGIEPFESFVRDKIGAILPMDNLAGAPAAIRELLADPEAFRHNVAGLRNEWVYNLGSSTEAAAAGAVEQARIARETRLSREEGAA